MFFVFSFRFDSFSPVMAGFNDIDGFVKQNGIVQQEVMVPGGAGVDTRGDDSDFFAKGFASLMSEWPVFAPFGNFVVHFLPVIGDEFGVKIFQIFFIFLQFGACHDEQRQPVMKDIDDPRIPSQTGWIIWYVCCQQAGCCDVLRQLETLPPLFKILVYQNPPKPLKGI